MSKYDYHKQFHDIFGHISTIRSVCSVIVEDYAQEIPSDLLEMVKNMYQHSNDLVPQIEKLKNQIYKTIKT